MTEIKHPTLETKKIIKATIAALIIALIILVIAVLPAEYGIDPTGAGKLFGFSKLYQPSQQEEIIFQATKVEQEAHPLLTIENLGSGPEVKKPKESDNPPPAKQYEEREDTIKVSVAAGKGIEYKINMLKHGKLKYEWATDSGTLYFDFHGEVKEAKPTDNVYFESYTVAYSSNMTGTFLSPYEGKHGWYFRNKSKTNIRVNLRLRGQYLTIE